jgi:hypothetical protein
MLQAAKRAGAAAIYGWRIKADRRALESSLSAGPTGAGELEPKRTATHRSITKLEAAKADCATALPIMVSSPERPPRSAGTGTRESRRHRRRQSRLHAAASHRPHRLLW